MMDKIGTSSNNWKKEKFEEHQIAFLQLISLYQEEHKKIKLGGGTIAIEKQHNKKRLTARERIDHLKHVSYVKEEGPGPITEEDKKKIMQDIEEFFKKGSKED